MTVEELRVEFSREKLKNELLNRKLKRLGLPKKKRTLNRQQTPHSTTGDSGEVECDTSTSESETSITVDMYVPGSSEKAHYCYYCFKSISKMARHLESCHKSEAEVAKVLLLPKKSDDRCRQFERIMCAGDFSHNTEVLRSGSGRLLVMRRPTDTECAERDIAPSDYVPCPGCLGFIVKCDLWRHARKC